MSLPPNFATPEDYFRESLSFFETYQQLFNFANTDVLALNILEQINVKHFENIDVFNENFKLTEVENCDEFVKSFLEDSRNLEAESLDIGILDEKVGVPLSPKKQHEIVYLAKELKDICDDSGCRVVVDFGSGLGYLDQRIHETSNLKVLGIECSESQYVSAKKRQRKYHPESVQSVKYKKHTITENSDNNIKEFVRDKFGDSRFCITGLHACADLTIDGFNLFLKMADAKALVLMPCCYHKMALKPNTEEFKNFPLSNCLKKIFKDLNGKDFIKIPFLRLGAQPPSTDADLEDLVFNLMARAVIQLYAARNNCKIKRKKRKAVRTRTIQNCFSDYLHNAITGFLMCKGDEETLNKEEDFNVEEIEKCWREAESLRLNAAIFVLLQKSLQPIIENFVLYDRVIYLKENGVQNSYCKKIFNENVSPRCLAVISVK